MRKKNRFDNIQAIFFDAGNTLFRPYPSVGHVYSRLAKKFGCDVSSEWVEKRFKTEWERRNGLAQLKSETQEKEWWRQLVRRVFGKTFPSRRAFNAYYDVLYHEFAHPRTWRLYEDTLPALKKLRQKGFRLGIVSNWDSRLFKLCDGLSVSEYMEFILASAVEGVVKPGKAIFNRGLEKMGLKPCQALHIGDSVREDYWGAQQAGLTAVLLCRNGTTPKGVLSVKSLKELFALLGKIE